MAVTINIYYTGEKGNPLKFAEEMISGGIVDKIRAQAGNLRYEYFLPFDNKDTVLLIDSWVDQEAIDKHHASPMMEEIIKLREKYELHMRVERYISDDLSITENDRNFIKD